MARRKIKDENEAKRFLRAADESGVPPREWARQHGIDGRSLRAWRMNLDRRQQREALYAGIGNAVGTPFRDHV